MAKTHLGRAVRTADKRAQYDAQIKNVLSNKWILAHILKATAVEVKELSSEIEEILFLCEITCIFI